MFFKSYIAVKAVSAPSWRRAPDCSSPICYVICILSVRILNKINVFLVFVR